MGQTQGKVFQHFEQPGGPGWAAGYLTGNWGIYSGLTVFFLFGHP